MLPFLLTINICMSRLITCFTLVDITPTGVTRSHPDNTKDRNKQRNWETVLQILGLKTQPVITAYPLNCQLHDLKNFE